MNAYGLKTVPTEVVFRQRFDNLPPEATHDALQCNALGTVGNILSIARGKAPCYRPFVERNRMQPKGKTI